MEYVGGVLPSRYPFSYFRAADINQGCLDDISLELFDPQASPKALKPGKIRWFAARAIHRRQMTRVNQLGDLVPIHQIIDAVGADEPVNGSLAAVLLLEVPDRFEGVAWRRFIQLVVADLEALLLRDGECYHRESIGVTGLRQKAFQRRTFCGNEDNFLCAEALARIRGHHRMAEMNRIEGAAEQCYLSFVHKQLTTNLCAIAEEYYIGYCKTATNKSHRRTTIGFMCSF